MYFAASNNYIHLLYRIHHHHYSHNEKILYYNTKHNFYIGIFWPYIYFIIIEIFIILNLKRA